MNATVTHTERPGETGRVINDARRYAWTPNERTRTAPAPGMVRVDWSDSHDGPYWEHERELTYLR